MYPESANQTVYSKMTGPKDGGNYSCLVRNDSHAYLHTVALQVIDAVSYMGPPLPTYELPDEQLVQIGSTARLFCEAFVGSIDLPDAQSEITWSRVGMNTSYLEEQRRFTLRSVARENNQVLGAYLTIRGVKKEDLGPYECRVVNAGDQAILIKLWLREAEPSEPLSTNPKWRQLAWAAIVVLAVAIILTAFRHRLGILALFCRHRLVQPDLQDGKDYDVLVSYLERDSGFASEMLTTLKERYSYTCNAFQIFPNADFCDCAQNLREAAKRSRRLMVIIRPSLVEALSGSVVMNTLGGSALPDRVTALQNLDDVDCWDTSVLASLLQQLIRLHPQPVCVSLQALPQGYEMRDHNLASLLRIAPVIEWNQKKSLWFKNWSLLRLRLPPLRTKNSTPSGSVAIVCPGSRKELGTGKVVTTVVSSRSRRSSPMNGSLEILV
ncbi:hypothetical protein FOCC_FOCC011877 [Frankliniella occidentalis]|nr:hypothetical protein FOCC_FOCC011877 [Frankliniella occidentalis]